jgi:hypothetical protein
LSRTLLRVGDQNDPPAVDRDFADHGRSLSSRKPRWGGDVCDPTYKYCRWANCQRCGGSTRGRRLHVADVTANQDFGSRALMCEVRSWMPFALVARAQFSSVLDPTREGLATVLLRRWLSPRLGDLTQRNAEFEVRRSHLLRSGFSAHRHRALGSCLKAQRLSRLPPRASRRKLRRRRPGGTHKGARFDA